MKFYMMAKFNKINQSFKSKMNLNLFHKIIKKLENDLENIKIL